MCLTIEVEKRSYVSAIVKITSDGKPSSLLTKDTDP